ncbi:hypothetical protein ILP97_06620 [Amycolatopsis sp. H6(2020)]|nr:hypothetical protein [Amycolatopsis sp. H6(2020)]
MPDVAPVDLARPYAHTPADVWPKGLDGVTSPAPAAVGAFKADTVAEAYAKVKQTINAAHLDPAVLTGHDGKAFAALFAPDDRDQILAELAQKPGFAAYVTEIADGYHLLDAGPARSARSPRAPAQSPVNWSSRRSTRSPTPSTTPTPRSS